MRLSRGSEAPSQKPPEIPLEIKVGKAAVPAEALRSRVPIRAHPRRLRLAEVLAALAPRLELPAQDNRQEHRRTPVLPSAQGGVYASKQTVQGVSPRWMKPRQRAAMQRGLNNRPLNTRAVRRRRSIHMGHDAVLFPRRQRGPVPLLPYTVASVRTGGVSGESSKGTLGRTAGPQDGTRRPPGTPSYDQGRQ